MMKSLKSIIAFVILLIGGMVVGCDRGTALEHGHTDQDKVEKTDITYTTAPNLISSEEEKVVLDSINRINIQLTDLNNKISQQEDVIRNNTRISVIAILVTLGIAIMSLIIAISAFVKAKGAIARSGRHRKEIDELKRSLSELEARVVNTLRNRGVSDYGIQSIEYSKLSSRICRIENQLQHQYQPIRSGHGVNDAIVDQQTPSYEEHGYFGLPSKISETQAYFVRLESFRNPDARFEVNVKNGMASFKPLEGMRYLNDLRGSDAIKMSLEIQGDTPSIVTQMTLINPGEAKLENGRWVITKKVIIRLS
ncbi:MAG: hypothetical protein K2M83_11670 [Muribaculaceae bacterium]|nr:hypothetical protein [Muribaculaceae bacterium]